MKEFAERILLGDAQKQFGKLFDVQAISELDSRSEVVLPQPVFDYARTRVERTLSDRRERLAFLNARGNSLAVRNERLGPPTVPGTQMSVYEGRFETFYGKFYGEPAAILFHTHPSVKEEELRGRVVPEIGGVKIDYSTLAELENIAGAHFSSGDIRSFEYNLRLYRSFLLGSEKGYKWIIQPDAKHLFLIPQTHKRYQRRGKALIDGLNDEAQQTGNIDLDRFNQGFNEALRRFCVNGGYLLFQNHDYQEPELERVV